MVSRITLSLKREAFRDPDMTRQYSTVVVAGHEEHNGDYRETIGAGTWRVAKPRKTTDFPPGLTTSDFPLTEDPIPHAHSATLFDNLEDGPRFPEPVVGSLSARDVHELRTLKASPLRPSFS